MTQTEAPPQDPRWILNTIADVLRGKRGDITLSAALEAHPDISVTLRDYIAQRFVTCTLAPSPSENDAPFWETIATLLGRATRDEREGVLDLFFEVQDPQTVYHVLAPVLREVFFPSMLEPVLLRKAQSDDPRVRANAREMDYFLFQARASFSMSPAGRAQLNALTAQESAAT